VFTGNLTGCITQASQSNITSLGTLTTLDVNGTTNLDAVDIDGNVQLDGTLTVGVDDTGYDVKFFGDTASAYMLWDASEDDLILGGAAGLSVAGDVAVDTDTFFVDVSTDRVGINEDSLTAADLTVKNGAAGAASIGVLGGGMGSVLLENTNVAIRGLSNNSMLLDSTAGISFRQSSSVKAGITTDGDFFVDTDTLYVDEGNDRVGIGTASPTSTLDVEGDADINGTTNLDAVDIDGNVQLDGTLTVGVNDTGYDVQFYGATADRFLKWDESENALCLTDNTNLKIGDDDDLQIYHSGGHNFISAEGGAGSLYIRPGSGNTVQIEDKDGQDMITAGGAGAVNLYYNNSVKIQTTTGGVCVTGDVCASGNGYFDCVIAGGYFEEKAANDELAEYETGSLVVIGKDGKLILSTKRNDKNVFGVTQKGAKQPIVLGAEPVLVTGEIKIGDYITTSNKPGHGERSTNTIHGTIIAQALESGNGESHIVKAMVRKM